MSVTTKTFGTLPDDEFRLHFAHFKTLYTGDYRSVFKINASPKVQDWQISWKIDHCFGIFLAFYIISKPVFRTETFLPRVKTQCSILTLLQPKNCHSKDWLKHKRVVSPLGNLSVSDRGTGTNFEHWVKSNLNTDTGLTCFFVGCGPWTSKFQGDCFRVTAVFWTPPPPPKKKKKKTTKNKPDLNRHELCQHRFQIRLVSSLCSCVSNGDVTCWSVVTVITPYDGGCLSDIVFALAHGLRTMPTTHSLAIHAHGTIWRVNISNLNST